MSHPWLQIPLRDYEGHMELPEVGQAMLLADLFEQALREYCPESVAVLGCAGGNGFDRIDHRITKRLVGIDFHPEYLATARRRYQHRIRGLELIQMDLQVDKLKVDAVDLVYAALVLEYIELKPLFENACRLMKSEGVLVVVIQLPGSSGEFVTPSPFTSLRELSPFARLRAPDDVVAQARSVGLELKQTRAVTSVAGKPFQLQSFKVADFS